MSCDAYRVAPFKRVGPRQLNINDDRHFVTTFAVFYESKRADGLPDMRAMQSPQSLLVDFIKFGMCVPVSVNAKAMAVDMEPPRSFVVMHRLSPETWVFIIVITTKIKTAVVIAKNLVGINFPKPGSSKVNVFVPEFMQSVTTFLSTLRSSITAAPFPGIGHAAPLRIKLSEFSNFSASQIGFDERVDTLHSTAASIILKHADEYVLNPFFSNTTDNLLGTLQFIAESKGGEFCVQMKKLVGHVFLDEDVVFDKRPTILEMSLDGIRAMLSGVTIPPICLSNSHINAIYELAGIPRPDGVPYTILLDDLISCTDARVRILFSDVLNDSPNKLPAWFESMDYMAELAHNVRQSTEPIGELLRRALLRISIFSNETPKWVTDAVKTLMSRFTAIPPQWNDASISRIDIDAFRMFGDASGLCSRFTHVQIFIAGSFSWSKLEPAKLVFNLYGETGSGKSYAKSTYTRIRGIIPYQGIHEGSLRSDFVASDKHHDSQDRHFTVADDTEIGMPVSGVLPEAVKSKYKQMLGVAQNGEDAPERTVVSNVDKKRRIEIQVLRSIAGGLFVTNSPMFVSTIPDPGLAALQTRLQYVRMPKYVNRRLCAAFSDDDKEWARQCIVYALSLTTVITLFQASLGISPTCPFAIDIFTYICNCVKDLRGSHIDFTEQGRGFVQFARTVGILANRNFTWRVASTGCDGELETVAQIVEESLHIVATPIECIQAALLVITGSFHSVPTSRLLEHDMVNECANPSANLNFSDSCVVNKSPLVLKLVAIGAAFEASDGRFAIAFDFLRRGVLEPSILPNVLDVALAKLGTEFTCGDLAKLLRIDESVAAFRLLWVYSLICPEHVRIENPGWIVNIATHASILEARLQRISLHAFEHKCTGFAPPSITPIVDAVCRKYHIDQPFFVHTNENLESVSPYSLSGPFYYRPPTSYSDTPVQVEIVNPCPNPGEECIYTCDIPLAAYHAREMWGTAESLAAAEHNRVHSYLPRTRYTIPTAFQRQEAVRDLPSYMPMTSRLPMSMNTKILYTDAIRMMKKK